MPKWKLAREVSAAIPEVLDELLAPLVHDLRNVSLSTLERNGRFEILFVKRSWLQVQDNLSVYWNLSPWSGGFTLQGMLVDPPLCLQNLLLLLYNIGTITSN